MTNQCCHLWHSISSMLQPSGPTHHHNQAVARLSTLCTSPKISSVIFTSNLAPGGFGSSTWNHTGGVSVWVQVLRCICNDIVYFIANFYTMSYFACSITLTINLVKSSPVPLTLAGLPDTAM